MFERVETDNSVQLMNTLSWEVNFRWNFGPIFRRRRLEEGHHVIGAFAKLEVSYSEYILGLPQSLFHMVLALVS